MIKEIEILRRESEIDTTNSNIDVRVEMINGDIFIPTFFTIENVRELMEQWKKTGEYNNGSHFWAADAIIVDSLDENNIIKIINYLVKEEEIYKFKNYNL